MLVFFVDLQQPSHQGLVSDSSLNAEDRGLQELVAQEDQAVAAISETPLYQIRFFHKTGVVDDYGVEMALNVDLAFGLEFGRVVLIKQRLIDGICQQVRN